ncbi:Rieske 2Fe-2S domain-containing protein [Paraburkholderia sp. CNPSo 3157]|uniref:Rieske 2Fe-2S domain-containing protein n=1 Tax=Paraburkholderia franconis TaxID=2654983 RepID=A0A7X1NI51_9BURK|nr:Rieske 2Fe-2S domain-containing protein [Paraburkholderia franconis]MPW22252.1 Rieske 2Fe-2S domain-containing protein [Paraburkholderia franconis]
MSETMKPAVIKHMPFGGYYRRGELVPDTELTSTDPGTPMGEYMRRFWQPVCLSEELTDLPKAIRILGEDLVAFRNRKGGVGVLHRHCSHRGASLEYGIVTDEGIRCCYHGWHYSADGTLLDTPCEPPESRLKETVCQGAYPAFERDGLVFAYFGRPDERPEFPVFDSYVQPGGTRLVPFSNVYPCNWLQVFENIMDHMHTAVLHNHMTVEGVDDETSAGVSLDGFGDMPVMQWEATRGGNGMIFIASRRLPEDKVWVRITEMVFPNFLQIGSLVPTAARERHSTTAMTRWQVPVDDTHMIIFGWRHFNDEVDPDHLGSAEDCGVDKIDFLVGQTGNRTYEEGQRAPGDWEALVSQRPVAIHAGEHPGKSDIGVYMCRKLLREGARGLLPKDTTRTRARANGDTLPMYAQDSVLTVPKNADDRALLQRVGKLVLSILKEADDLPSHERDAHVRRRLDEIDGQGEGFVVQSVEIAAASGR